MGRKYLDKVEIKGLVYLLSVFPLNNPSKMTFLHNNNQEHFWYFSLFVAFSYESIKKKKRLKNLTRKRWIQKFFGKVFNPVILL